MHEEHPEFHNPSNEQVKIWRYMDLAKFVSLVDSSQLFFSRCDRLGDPFEGSWPKFNVESRNIVPETIPAEQQEGFLQFTSQFEGISKNLPRYVAANCWHCNEHESAAMWKLYLKSNEGIAVQSTYFNLKKSIIDDERVFLGQVNYIDYELDRISDHNVLTAFVHKRKSFEHEREIRALVAKWPSVCEGESGKYDFSKDTIDGGVKVDVDMRVLVERVYVAPTSPVWFADLVRAIIQKYDFDFEVIHSKLDQEPVY